MSTHKNTWKQMERRVAQLLGGKRAMCSGNCEADRTDVIHPIFTISCKYREHLQVYTWWDEVVADAKRTKKTPLLVIKQKGERGELAVVPLEFLATLLKRSEQ